MTWKKPSPKAWRRYWYVVLGYDVTWLVWNVIQNEPLTVGLFAVLTLFAITGLHWSIRDSRKEKK